MKSIRRRTMTLIIGVLLAGLLILTLFNVYDSNHEVAEIYDAQLAQNARLLQGVMSMPLAPEEHQQLYQAFNQALQHGNSRSDGHPYESKLAFQAWRGDGQPLVHTASAPLLAPALQTPGFSDLTDLNGHKWRAFVLSDQANDRLIWVGERAAVRTDLVDRIIHHTLWPNVLGSLLLVAIVWVAIGIGLKPLSDLARTLRERSPGSLEPLTLAPLPAELEPMQAALNRMLAQVQELLRRERRFIADAAHEMRTPLAVLKVHAQNLMEAGNDAQKRKSLDYLVVGVDRTTRLVNQLLTIARLEPHAPIHLAPVNIVEALRDAIAQLTPWVIGQGVDLSFEYQGNERTVETDLALLNIALQNLVSNAVKFSPPGGQVQVSLTFNEASLMLTVDDEGPGISLEQQSRLFERFFSQGNEEGVGLGLAIVQAIAQRLQGHVHLQNREGRGLRACLTVSCKGSP